LYPSPNLVRAIKSRRIRWVGHVEPMIDRERERERDEKLI